MDKALEQQLRIKYEDIRHLKALVEQTRSFIGEAATNGYAAIGKSNTAVSKYRDATDLKLGDDGLLIGKLGFPLSEEASERYHDRGLVSPDAYKVVRVAAVDNIEPQTCAPKYRPLADRQCVSVMFAPPRHETFNISTGGNAFLIGHEEESRPKTEVSSELATEYRDVDDLRHDYATAFTAGLAITKVVDRVLFRACGVDIIANFDDFKRLVNAWRIVNPAGTETITEGSFLEMFLARTNYQRTAVS